MFRRKLQYQHKSAFLVIGLFILSLMLPACTDNGEIIPGLKDSYVCWGSGLFVSSFFAVFVLSPVGLTHVVLLKGVLAQSRRRWKKAAVSGVVAFLLAATTFQFYDPQAELDKSWNHMTGRDHSKFRITKLLPGFYCWWACGPVLAGAGLFGMWRFRNEE